MLFYISIKRNKEREKDWDINEDKGFKMVEGFKINTQVINHSNHSNHKNHVNCAKFLYCINNYINLLQGYVLKNYPNDPSCKLFGKMTHMIQEIDYNTNFEGINKPKKIHLTNEFPQGTFDKHNMYIKPEYRLIMLSLRDHYGNFKPWKDIKKTLLHELAHTMRNHCVYFDKENHKKDFHKAEKLLTMIANNYHITQDGEQLIKTLFYSNSTH